MNDLEVTMPAALPTRHGFEALELASAAAGAVLGIVRSVPPGLGDLTDQLRRAACSVPLNLAEGAGHRGRPRMHHWRIAYGSVRETIAALEILRLAGAVDGDRVAEALQLLDRVGAMTWRLTECASVTVSEAVSVSVSVSVTVTVSVSVSEAESVVDALPGPGYSRSPHSRCFRRSSRRT